MTYLLALPGSPERERRPTMTARLANFGVHRPQRAAYDAADPQSVLGRLLLGFVEDRTTPWVTFTPDAVVDVRRDVVRAIATAKAAASADPDDYADWFESQLRAADRVLAHAALASPVGGRGVRGRRTVLPPRRVAASRAG
jgi:hypothetical protein